MSSKRRVGLQHLGTGALKQLEAQGINVKAELARRAKGAPVESERKHKFGVSAPEERTTDNIVFASKLERAAYQYLTNHKVKFDRQPEYVLQEKFKREGRMVRAIKYVGDFRIYAPDGRTFLVDTKGVKTAMFRMKQKMMLRVHGIEIHCFAKLEEFISFLYEQKVLTR